MGTPFKEGNVYINYHTETYPAGELRGQLNNDISCPVAVNIFETEGESFELTLFPNPTQDQIMLRWDDDANKKMNLTIRTISGQIVYQSLIQNDSSIDVSNLSKGIYLVELRIQYGYGISRMSKL